MIPCIHDVKEPLSPARAGERGLFTPPQESLSTEFGGGADGDRTHDLLLAKQALSQLSYGPPAHYSTPLQGGP